MTGTLKWEGCELRPSEAAARLSIRRKEGLKEGRKDGSMARVRVGERVGREKGNW